MILNRNVIKGKKTLSFKGLWCKEQFERLRLLFPKEKYSAEELRNFILEEYDKRYIAEGRFFNNVNNSNYAMTQEDFIDLFLNSKYILSGYCVLYKNQDDAKNIASDGLVYILNNRKKNKNKMEAAEHGSSEYIYYRIIQLVWKIIANSYYGCLGEKNSIFYNPLIQNSITATGQDLITTSIIAMENFVANNVPYNGLDDVILLINNVNKESREYSILDYVKPKSKEDIKEYLINKSYIKFDEDILDSILNNLDSEVLTRIYFKNNLSDLFKEDYFSNLLHNMLKYNYFGEPDEEMKNDLENLRDLTMKFVFYNQLIEDRYKRSIKDKRKAVITIDTDSNFINLNNHINNIKNSISKFGDEFTPDNKQTVINILINIITLALKNTFYLLTTNMGLIDDAKPIINMKNEFVYKRILLTHNKKNYAGIVATELGKKLEHPVLDMKGIAIRKSTTPKLLREQFSEILEDDILKSDKIDLKTILKKYDKISDNIIDSINNQETYYTIPKNIENLVNYKDPSSLEPVRGMLTWNALEPDKEIVPPEKVNLLKLNAKSPQDPRFEKLKEEYPKKYEAIMKTVFQIGTTGSEIDFSRFGLSCIAIPKSEEKIPDYIIPFIDMEAMVNANVSNGNILLESLGVCCMNLDTINYKTNIIEL